MIDCKTTLMVVGAIVAIMGILGILPAVGVGPIFMDCAEPVWHAALKIVVGAAALWIATQQK